jgi:hypothetical protein
MRIADLGREEFIPGEMCGCTPGGNEVWRLRNNCRSRFGRKDQRTGLGHRPWRKSLIIFSDRAIVFLTVNSDKQRMLFITIRRVTGGGSWLVGVNQVSARNVVSV